MKKWLWSTTKWLLYFAFVAALIWGLPRFLSSQLNSANPIAAVTSGSMWPELKRGDLVVIEGVSKENLKIGDIVVWKTPSTGSGQGGFVIHRVVAINKENIVTKGDANFSEDSPVTFDRVIGRALKRGESVWRIPYLGFMSIIGAEWRQKI